METATVQQSVDTSKIPGATLAEFGKREFDSKTKDDLSALEAEINAHLTGTPIPATVYEAPAGQPAPAPAPVVAPPAPAPAPAPSAFVPEKFANPDGSLNTDKLEKSTISLDAYLAKERELSALKAQPFQQQQPQYQQPMPQPQYQSQFVPIEQQVNDGMRQDPGLTALNLARAAVAQSQAYSDAQLREVRSRQELMEMGQNDPAVFTADGLAKLTAIRQANPWLDAAPNPWFAAYKMSGGIAPRSAVQQAAPARPVAPILPGGQAPAGIPVGSQHVASEGDLRRALENKFPNDPAKQFQALEAIIARQAQR